MADTQVMTKKGTIQAYLEDPFVKRQIERAIPRHMTSDRLLRVFLTSIQGNERLRDCTPKSLLGCLMTSAQLGLEPSPVTGHAALVPYKREAQFQIMYKGLLELVRRSGELKSVQAQVVYDNDAFTLQYGLEDKLEHIPTDGDRGAPKGAYCVFRYKDGAYSFDYMSKNDIEKIRKRSKAGQDGPWVTDWDEMAKKTIIKRHCKLAPVSIEVQKASALDDRIEMGVSQMDLLGDGEAIDVQALPEEATPELPDIENAITRLREVFAADSALLEEWLEKVASANGMTVGDLGGGMTHEEMETFVQTCTGKFLEFRAKQKPTKKPTKKATEPLVPGTVETDTITKDRLIPCPEGDGEARYESYCNGECQSRAGCPSWPEE